MLFYSIVVYTVRNPDREVRSSRSVQCRIVYPSARPDLRIRIGHWFPCIPVFALVVCWKMPDITFRTDGHREESSSMCTLLYFVKNTVFSKALYLFISADYESHCSSSTLGACTKCPWEQGPLFLLGLLAFREVWWMFTFFRNIWTAENLHCCQVSSTQLNVLPLWLVRMRSDDIRNTSYQERTR